MSIFDEIEPVRGLWGDTVTTATNTAADAPGGVFIALRAFDRVCEESATVGLTAAQARQLADDLLDLAAQVEWVQQ